MKLFALARHELICRLRSEPPHLLLALSVVVLGALAIIPLWLFNSAAPHPAAMVGFSAVGSPASLSWLSVLTAHRAEVLVVLLSLGFAVVTTIVAPVAACATLNRERDSRAIDGLLLTGMNPLAIVLGKFLAALARTLLVLGAGLPAFAVAWLFGGVGLEVVALTGTGIGALAVAGVALGLFMSTVTRSNLAAVLASYAVLSTAMLVLPAAALIAAILDDAAPAHHLVQVSMPLALLGAHSGLVEAAYRLIPLPFRYLLLQPGDMATHASLARAILATTIAGYLAASGLLVTVSSILLDPLHPVRGLRPRLPWRGAAP